MLDFYIIFGEQLRDLIYKAHIRGFLDGLDNNCYKNTFYGYEKTAGEYVMTAIQEFIKEREESESEDDDDDDDDEYYGKI